MVGTGNGLRRKRRNSKVLCAFAMIFGTRLVDKEITELLSGAAFWALNGALLDVEAIRDVFTRGYDTMGNGVGLRHPPSQLHLQFSSVQLSLYYKHFIHQTSKSTNETNPLPLKQPNPTAWNDTPGMLFSPRGESSTTFSRHPPPLAR